jgi:preprotein translocase subunit Sec61beta
MNYPTDTEKEVDHLIKRYELGKIKIVSASLYYSAIAVIILLSIISIFK